ncbi:MAG: AraC family transcriptional regulator [Sediminibacterium sp.]|nr:AraC family transcriptional regulator [Sediminibacterium sp.]
MKPTRFHNPKLSRQSFFVMDDLVPYFYDTLHYHPEFQLTLIINGTGYLLLGDYIGRFKPGDIFLIGPNVAHVFKCDNEYYVQKNKLYAHAISVYFKFDSFGEAFFDLPENEGIKKLLKTSLRGIKTSAGHTLNPEKLIKNLNKLHGMERLTTFLLCLDTISKLKSTRLALASEGAELINSEEDNNRMEKVIKYILNNFTKEIKLKTVAEIAHMTPSAFCRFFSKKTRKTLSAFVIETRVGYACKLIIQNKYPIIEIAYKCGYNNISNFNRQFKKITQSTPRDYLKKITRTER